MRKILVLGSSGFLGRNILERESEFDVTGSYYKEKTTSKLIKIDLNKHNVVKKNIFAHKPDIVVDASQYDFQNMDQNLAIETSKSNAKNLISICNKINANLLFISSDSVFDGKRGNYTEKDNSHPINLYGKIKYAQEKSIKENANNFLIVRTSLLFGWGIKKWNFVTWVINNLKKNKPIKVIRDQYISPSYCPNVAVIRDQYISPSYCPNVADMILDSIRLDLKGIIHLAGSTQLTRLEFAKLVCKTFFLDQNFLTPIGLNETNLDLMRGNKTTLNVDMAKKLLKIKPLSAHKSLEKMNENHGLTTN